MTERAVYAFSPSFARVRRRVWRLIREAIRHWRRAFAGRGAAPINRGGAAHLALGALGEGLALGYLRRCGYRVVATNFSAPIGRRRDGRLVTGEIDIIAYDETTDPPTLAFIEVKTRSSDTLAAPASAVDRRKQRRIVRTARLYRRLLRLNGAGDKTGDHNDEFCGCGYRYDVVGIVAAPGEETRIELYRGYFTERVMRRNRWPGRE